jgi:hypothetical protein
MAFRAYTQIKTTTRIGATIMMSSSTWVTHLGYLKHSVRLGLDFALAWAAGLEQLHQPIDLLL